MDCAPCLNAIWIVVLPKPGFELRPMTTLAPDGFPYRQVSTLVAPGVPAAGCRITSWPISRLTSSAVASSQALGTLVARVARPGGDDVAAFCRGCHIHSTQRRTR